MISIKKFIQLVPLILIGSFIVLLPLQYNKQFQVYHKQNENSQTNQHIPSIPKDNPTHNYPFHTFHQSKPFYPTNNITMITLGDSLTEGIGDETNRGGYVKIMEDALVREGYVVTIRNFGERGSRSDHLLNRLEEKEMITQISNAHIILITIGANDIMQVFKENITNIKLKKFTKEQNNYAKRLHQLFTKMKQINQNAQIYLIGIYNPFKEYFKDIEELDVIVENWNQTSHNVTKRFNKIYFIPIKDLFDHSGIDYLADDHFHPNHLGYRLIASRVLQYIWNEGD